MSYWLVRKILRWIANLLGQQCSGKIEVGNGIEWCRFRAFHDGTCESWDKEPFTRD